MTITDTKILTEIVPASAYKFTITGHSGLTVKLQYEDDGGWHDIADSESTSDWDAYIDAPAGALRVHLSAPGTVYVNYAKARNA